MNKIKNITIIFILFIIPFILTSNIYAKNKKDSEWNIRIFDTKDCEKTNNIEFKVEENIDVVKGKIAPGLKATAKVTIDLTGTEVPVDIIAEIDDKKLNSAFKLKYKLDGKKYNSGTIETIKLEKNSKFNKKNGKKILTLEIEWINDINNDENDTILGIEADSITIPVKINVRQHI